MKINKGLVRVISLLLIPCFLVACTGYNRVAIPKDSSLPVAWKVVILHRGADQFYLADVKITDELLEALVEEIRAKPRSNKSQELHIYASENAELPESLPATASIPFAEIEKIEVYDVSTGKTIGYSVAAGVGIIVAAFFVFLVILSAPSGGGGGGGGGGSCPFIYAFDGDSYEFTGEIFGGTIFPPLERHDYLPLPSLKPIDGEYRVKLANELREIQHTNLTELLVIDHPRNVEVLVDKYGVPHTLAELHSPKEAVTLRGEDVRDSVVAADHAVYIGEFNEEVNCDADGIVLTFDRPRGAAEAKLVVQGKNSLWLEYVMSQLCELFGDGYNEWFEERKEIPAEELRRWSLDQGIPLSVYVEEGGEWRFVDYYDIVGPMAAKRDVLPLDISDLESDEVRVKLEFGSLFWEIDSVAIDFSADLPVQSKDVPLTSAFDQDGRDVAEALLRDDGRYYVQTKIGEHAFISFPAPETTDGLARTTILHSKGHYEVLRNPQGKPDRERLYSLEEPGRFIEFSKGLFLNIYQEMIVSHGG